MPPTGFRPFALPLRLTPIARRAGLSFFGERSLVPSVVEAVAARADVVHVIFSFPMMRNAELTALDNYTIAADIGSAARSVIGAAAPHSSGIYVVLQLDGDLTPGTLNYNVAVRPYTGSINRGVESFRGVPLDGGAADTDFDGPEQFALPPVTFTRIDSTHVRAHFASPVLYIPTLFVVEAFEVSPDLEVLSVAPDVATITPASPYDLITDVILTVKEQSPTTYTGTVFGLEIPI